MNEVLNVERIKKCPKCGDGRVTLKILKAAVTDMYEFNVTCDMCKHSTGWCYPEWYVIQKWEEK